MEYKSTFEPQIALAISRYARNRNDKEDLKQEARLAILSTSIPNKAYAYKVAKNKIIDCIRKTRPAYEDISDKQTLKRIDKQINFTPNYINSLFIRQCLEKLSEPYKFIIQCSFGIDEPQQTAEQIGLIFHKSEDWVNIKKKQAVERLKVIMEVLE